MSNISHFLFGLVIEFILLESLSHSRGLEITSLCLVTQTTNQFDYLPCSPPGSPHSTSTGSCLLSCLHETQ